MKRNLFLIVTIFVGIIVVMFLGDIITIGEKLSKVTHLWYAEYVLYAILLALLSCFVLFPIIKVHYAPQIPPLSCSEEIDLIKLKKFGFRLADNCYHIPDKTIREDYSNFLRERIKTWYDLNDIPNLKKTIEIELDCRIKGVADPSVMSQDEHYNRFKIVADLGVMSIDKKIKEYAVTVFMVTAVSPNSKVDAFSMLVLNYTMIKNLIVSTGFRPTNAQLWKLYWRILITSLLSYSVSEALKNVGSIKPFEFLEDIGADDATDTVTDAGVGGDTDSFSITKILSGFKIPAAIAGPVLDGATNALMTLRIGYVTKAFLQEGLVLSSDREKRAKAKREANVSALKTLPVVLFRGTKSMGKRVQKLLEFCGYKVEDENDN